MSCRATNETNKIVLDGNSLSFAQVVEFLEDPSIQVQLGDAARQQVDASRKQLEAWLKSENRVVYGLNTGLGKLKDFVVSEKDQAEFQKNILYSHAVGLGAPFDSQIARLAMLFRANVLSRGHSGVRPELIDRILLLLNAGIIPQMPQIGSLGVGDLQPMAHLGLCLAGYPEGRVVYQGQVETADTALAKAGISPVEFSLAAREALALMSGSTVMLAAAVHCYYVASKRIVAAEAALALNLEAIRGERQAFDFRIHAARGIAAQVETAKNICALTAGSSWMSEAGRQRLGENQPRVQDAVSFRSSAQVHGAVRDVLQYIETILERELNASTDNPLLFESDQGYESMSGGNFHGALLAYAMDFLAIVFTDLAVLSERRSARLLDPVMSYGLPSNLAGGQVGLNTGFALVQADAAALIGEMRILAAPASIGSVPSKSNQEDHNSMGMGAVRKAMLVLEHLNKVLAVEMLCAAQAIELIAGNMQGLSLGIGTQAIYGCLRQHTQGMQNDRYIREDLYRVIELIDQSEFIRIIKLYEAQGCPIAETAAGIG
ncbi:HAL/PAL/TAL family ammonia-lyase [Propionispora vibrioides]|uniref:Histidine ammonia-lyase n=1 Tax=Propionispora vibrioides TaxID=112903 RepID=A0A1H8WRS6_9FIRM|nr:aromatic amino acid ammonia-lyase [Propionispora vibrioides]SEP30341.1 histidine ammonia-lyase [Propionispora vibrioides]